MNTRIHSTRLLGATPEAVFEAFRQPERLARWWGPAGFTNTFQEFDFREGGDWRFDMRGPDGRVYPNRSHFVEIVPVRKIVIEHIGAIHHFFLTISLSEEHGRTRIDWEMVFDSPEERDRVLPYVPKCNEENFDRLEVELSRDQSGSGFRSANVDSK